MANTRFFYDPSRTNKALQQATGPGRWVLDVPGNGTAPPYMADPHIHLQQWGANVCSDPIACSNTLLGYTQQMSKYDSVTAPRLPSSLVTTDDINTTLSTGQSRATHPAWWYRTIEQANWQSPWVNPQANVCLPFLNNINTRLVEKDHFQPCTN